LNSETKTDAEIARGIIYALLKRDGDAWVASVLNQAFEEDWRPDAVMKVALVLRPSRVVWDWVGKFRPEVAHRYWAEIQLFGMLGSADDRTFAATKLLDAKRARETVRFMGHSSKDCPSSLLIRALNEAAREPWPQDNGNEGTMFLYSVEEILLQLDRGNDVTQDEIATLEWTLLPLLRYSRRPPTVLHKNMSTTPAFFVTVVSAVYRPDPESGVPEPAAADLEAARAIATQAYQLLTTWHLVPGEENRSVNASVLEEWVKEARIRCKGAGRLAVGDQHIGNVLAHSPADSDGVWPAIAVRDLIEITRSRDLEKGVSMGVRNKRGVTSRGMTDGGAQERALAATYHEWSHATELQWPRTSALLEQIAKSYEHEASSHDEDAERYQW
jgi:hypothetical protein